MTTPAIRPEDVPSSALAEIGDALLHLRRAMAKNGITPPSALIFDDRDAFKALRLAMARDPIHGPLASRLIEPGPTVELHLLGFRLAFAVRARIGPDGRVTLE